MKRREEENEESCTCMTARFVEQGDVLGRRSIWREASSGKHPRRSEQPWGGMMRISVWKAVGKSEKWTEHPELCLYEEKIS